MHKKYAELEIEDIFRFRLSFHYFLSDSGRKKLLVPTNVYRRNEKGKLKNECKRSTGKGCIIEDSYKFFEKTRLVAGA